MSEIKLEVGKTYRNREGKEVKIERKDGEPFPYLGDDKRYYAEDGSFWHSELPEDLIEEVPTKAPGHTLTVPDGVKEVTATRHTFTIPEGTKGITVEQVSNRIVVEMVPGKEPKPGDVMVNDVGSVYIFKSAWGNGESHKPFAYLGDTGKLFFAGWCSPGRPATPEEAQPLWDALKKAGKRWNPQAMKVEDVPEIDRIREWVEKHFVGGLYTQEDIAEVIETYLEYKEGQK